MYFLIEGGLLMQRKILSFLLIIFIIAFQVDQTKKQAQAIVPVIAVATQIAIAAGLITAGGITLLSNDAVRAAGYKFLTEAPTDVYNAIKDNIEGKVLITEGIWQFIRAWNQTNLIDTTTQIVSPIEVDINTTYTLANLLKVRVDEFGILMINGQIKAGSLYLPYQLGMLSTDFVTAGVEPGYDYVARLMYESYLGVETVLESEQVIFANRNKEFSYSVMIRATGTSRDVFNLISGATLFTDAQIHKLGEFTNNTGFPLTYFWGALAPPVTLEDNINYVTNNYITTPSLAGQSITVPTDIGAVVGKTYEDINTDINAVAAAAAAAAIAAALALGYSQAAAEVAGAAAAAAILSGATAAEAATTAAAAAASYVDAVPITTGIANTKPGDVLDFSKLKFAASLFTNKFPFSLPWDIQRMLLTFGAGNVATPIIQMPIMGVPADVSLSQFDNLASAARVFELFLFNIGLLFGTRKLLGGSS